MRKPLIFICYSHKDKESLDQLLRFITIALGDTEHRLFSDQDIEPGEWWERRIREQIEQADIALLLLSIDVPRHPDGRVAGATDHRGLSMGISSRLLELAHESAVPRENIYWRTRAVRSVTISWKCGSPFTCLRTSKVGVFFTASS